MEEGRRAIIMISSIGYREHTSKQFQKHKLLKLVDINEGQITNFVFNYHNHTLPNIFRSYFSVNNQINHHSTRALNKLNEIRFESNVRFYFIRIQGPHIWNSKYLKLHPNNHYHSLKKQSRVSSLNLINLSHFQFCSLVLYFYSSLFFIASFFLLSFPLCTVMFFIAQFNSSANLC